MEKTLLNCWSCGEQLDAFEEKKWNALVEYKQGKLTPDQHPNCRNCYWKILEDRKGRYEEGR